MPGELSRDINIKEPRWDQGTFMTLEEARVIVDNYRAGIVRPGLTEDELWRAKYVYDSAFHPDTGEKMFVIGRMSAQVPMNMTITGCMLTFYRTTPAVVFWQWVNQSFNAVVNYTNRSGDAPMTVNQLGAAYVSATTGAVVTAWRLPPIVSRFVPFFAVAALKYGIPVTDENGNRLGESANAAQQAIAQVVVSRIGMAMPAMAIPPVIMNALEKRAFMKVRFLFLFFSLVFATPLCCALFPQKRYVSTLLLLCFHSMLWRVLFISRDGTMSIVNLQTFRCGCKISKD
uniref:Sideroflexin-3 n=1 Tax=Neogobius melanostomus TaxID=47308 RepID=A0A8C6URS4_9GOBI